MKALATSLELLDLSAAKAGFGKGVVVTVTDLTKPGVPPATDDGRSVRYVGVDVGPAGAEFGVRSEWPGKKVVRTLEAEIKLRQFVIEARGFALIVNEHGRVIGSQPFEIAANYEAIRQVIAQAETKPYAFVDPVRLPCCQGGFGASGLTRTQGPIVATKISLLGTAVLSLLTVIPGACSSGPHITRLQPASEPADAPYQNIPVVSLFESFDARRYLDEEIVKQLAARGVKGVAMTSLANSTTPVNRDTVVKLVERINADSVLVTQLISLETSAKLKHASPQATYNFRPTYYYNVYSVELTEYVEPEYVEFNHTLALETDLFSAESQQKVWAIASESNIKQRLEHFRDYSKIVDEAEAIVHSMAQDQLIAR